MKAIKKSTCTILFILASIGLKAQDTPKWHELVITNQGPYQAKGITVKLFKETYSGLEGQQYTVVFTNISTQKLKIKGSLAAQTYCGNSLSISFETTIKPGESLGGKDYLMDDLGLTGTVHSEDCKTDKIYPDPNDKNSYKYDRIRALQLGALNINAVDTLAKTTANIGDQSSKQTNNLAAISKPAYKPLTTSSGNAKQTTVQKQRQQQANNYVNAANNSIDDIQKATDLSLANINAVASGNKAQAAQIPLVQQKAAYQQAANNYVNAANNTTDNDIQKAMNLNLAKINAAASGNKAQVAQIQQAQNQQTQSGNASIQAGLQNIVSTLQAKQAQDQAEGAAIIANLENMQNIRLQEVRQQLSNELGNLKNAGPDYNSGITYLNNALHKLFVVNNYQMFLSQSTVDYYVIEHPERFIINNFENVELKCFENHLIDRLNETSFGASGANDIFNILTDACADQMPNEFMKVYIKVCRKLGPLGAPRDLYPVLDRVPEMSADEFYNNKLAYSKTDFYSAVEALKQCSNVKSDTLDHTYLHVDEKKIDKNYYIQIPPFRLINVGDIGYKMALINFILADICYADPNGKPLNIAEVKSYLDRSFDEILRVKRLSTKNAKSFKYKDYWVHELHEAGVNFDNYLIGNYYDNDFVLLLYSRYAKLYEYAITHTNEEKEKAFYYNEALTVLNKAMEWANDFSRK